MKKWLCLAAILFLVLTLSGLAEGVPTFANVFEAVDYFDEQVQDCPEIIEFYLSNVDEYEDLSDLAVEVRALSGTYRTWVRHDGDLCQVKHEYYPGTRILRAIRRGDFSDLTDEEVQAASIAQQVAQEACAYSSAYERILYLHDWLCAHVTYEKMPDEPPTMPRVCGAVGALVDGRANCQGYVDAFRLLGRLAGLEVRKQMGHDGREDHDWNVVELDGEWYIVDVTQDDLSDDGVWGYAYMIVGRDLCDHTWREELSVAPVATYSRDDLWYYSLESAEFDSLYDMARAAYVARRDWGQNTYRAMLVNQESSWEDLSDALLRVAQEQGKRCYWYVWYMVRSGHTYYQVNWTEW